MSSTLEGDHPLGISGSVAAAAPTCKCLNERDPHLFCPGPKSILALDGGGVRGAITVAFLEQIEKVLTERLGEPVHLANWFDLVGGTSTGAVIAGALAVGYTTEDIRKFYLELAPKVFRRSLWRLLTLRPKFDAEALRKEIERVVGNRKLSSSDLNTASALSASDWTPAVHGSSLTIHVRHIGKQRVAKMDTLATSTIRLPT